MGHVLGCVLLRMGLWIWGAICVDFVGWLFRGVLRVLVMASVLAVWQIGYCSKVYAISNAQLATCTIPNHHPA